MARLSAPSGTCPRAVSIILGLDEHNDFIPVGLSDVATLEQGVAGQAREAVTPPVACAFSTHSVDGADVLVVEVEGLPLMSRPARYGGTPTSVRATATTA